MKFIKLLAALSIGRLIFLAVLLTIGYFFTYFDDGSNLKTQIEAANSLLDVEVARRAGIEKTMKKEEEMRANTLQLQRNLEVVKAKIPNEFKDTQMSSIINNASVASGVQIIELSSSTDQEPKRETSDEEKPDLEKIKPEDLISEVKFKITLVGKYESLIQFLDVLTKEDKIIKVKNFFIEKNSQELDDEDIKFSGEVIGFKQSELSLKHAQAQGVQ